MFIDWDERPDRGWTQVQHYTGKNDPVFEEFKLWPPAALAKLDEWEGVARSRHGNAEPVGVDHHCTLAPDGFWYFERSLHFAAALAASRGDVPAGESRRDSAAGGPAKTVSVGVAGLLPARPFHWLGQPAMAGD